MRKEAINQAIYDMLHNELYIPLLKDFVAELKTKMQGQHILGCGFVTENDIDKTLEEFLEGGKTDVTLSKM